MEIQPIGDSPYQRFEKNSKYNVKLKFMITRGSEGPKKFLTRGVLEFCSMYCCCFCILMSMYPYHFQKFWNPCAAFFAGRGCKGTPNYGVDGGSPTPPSTASLRQICPHQNGGSGQILGTKLPKLGTGGAIISKIFVQN